MAPSHRVITSYFLLGNLHCPTCVSSIKDALQPIPGVTWVSPNLVTSWVAVEHDPDILVTEMASKLESAGFEVSSIASKDDDLTPASLLSGAANSPGFSESGGVLDYLARLPGKLTQLQASAAKPDKQRKHLEACEHCRSTGSRPKAFKHASCSSTSSNACQNQLGDEKIEEKKSADGRVTVTEDDERPQSPRNTEQRWRASMVIGDLVCAACEQSASEPLKEKPWITRVSISFITKSGIVEYIGTKEDANQIVEMIEDTGKEAKLVKVESMDDDKNKTKQQRTVEIHIDGFYCDHCADRVTNSLGGLRGKLKVITKPTRETPILTINYDPVAPHFTIRRILEAIQATDPAFKASIFHRPTLEEESKQLDALHQKQMRLRAWFTSIVAIPTFVIGVIYMSLMPDHNPGKMFLMEPWTSGISRAQIALCIMATPVYVFAADIFHRRAIVEIIALWKRKRGTGQHETRLQRVRTVLRRFYRFGSMNMLMSLGTTIAYVSSVSQLLVAAVDRPAMVNDANFYFDSVVFLTFFLLWGRVIEAYSKSKTGDAVEALSKLRPTTAVLVEETEDNKEADKVVTADLLEFGDIVRVPHGGSPPCDGKITRGGTDFDESSLTGESRPVKKGPGDDVFAGTVNKGSPVLVQITGASGQSMLDQIVSIVRECQTKPSQMENLAGHLTAYFVPFITLIAIITWLVWLLLGVSGAIPEHYLDVSSGGWVAFSLQFAISVFVVACPCGLGLATPTAVFVGSGLAAKHGLLVKGGGEAFEKASQIDCVVFDKTGTLTMGGEPKITDSMVFPGYEVSKQQRDAFFAALRATEEKSTHPIAKAIVSFCNAETTERTEVDDSTVEEIPGKGLKATYHAGSPPRPFDIVIGNEALMRDFGVIIPLGVATNLQTWKTEAKSVALVAVRPTDKPNAQPSLAAALAISDPVRPETPAVIRALRARGTDVWMLSGDNATTARAVALRVGIPEANVIAEVLPAQKHEKITWLQSTLKARRRRGWGWGWGGKEEGEGEEDLTGGSRRATVAMVGDGINDAPALSQADVGIAIGSGSDVAISSSDFVLVGSNLASLVTLLDLSRTVFRRIKFNFAWALVYNLLAVPIAAGCLYPIVVGGNGGQHVRLAPSWASLAMALSSISVVLSSLAMRSRIPGIGFRVRMKVSEPEAGSASESGLRERERERERKG
ncbi:heavy metal translocatin [Hypoxylon rubiginosum]|uniref:Heavy metal translocatin n=1 Tax=Hypoxylon rubiginosum TaxID=110542 RepID=A0ACB9YTD2_9PEZI|nr:heavy metal translocatin [Hypoxylon rubiginosum]